MATQLTETEAMMRALQAEQTATFGGVTLNFQAAQPNPIPYENYVSADMYPAIEGYASPLPPVEKQPKVAAARIPGSDRRIAG